MAKADVTTLAQFIAGGQADEALLSRYYDDLIDTLAQTTDTLIEMTLSPLVSGQSVYTPPDTITRLISVICGDRELDLASRKSMEATNSGWRKHEGIPVTYIRESEDQKQIRLYPIPDMVGDAFIPWWSSPVGEDYPNENLVYVHTHSPTDVPNWMNLGLALLILVPEFLRDSPHQDADFADACQAVADLVTGAMT